MKLVLVCYLQLSYFFIWLRSRQLSAWNVWYCVLRAYVLTSGTQVRGFKPSRGCRIKKKKKNPQLAFGVEVKPSVPCRRFAACERSLHLPWKSHTVGKIGSAISRPFFPPSLIDVSHVAGRGAPLVMTGENKSGAQRDRSYGLGTSGLQASGSAPTLLYYNWF
jgi:hypothetical protein